jgi:2-polyprenyl-6-methoxyphenol hydroxylase-like FAD-dependent oxidoreductase
MTHIGIVGAGVAGLHLGLYLRQHGIETTLYAERTPGQQFGSRIPALVARVGHTRERERQLGVNHWDGGNNEFTRLNVQIGGEQPMGFTGNVPNPFIAVDMRIYLGRLQEDFVARGGHVVIGEVQASDLERLSDNHDLLVVASGRGGLSSFFPRIAEHSPFDQPQRWICTGIFRGLHTLPSSAGITFLPGHGEIFEFPIFSFEPNVVGLGIEAVPGGALEAVARMRYDDDPAAFNAALLELLREHVPHMYERIDPEQFGLTRSLDLLQGGVTPGVRQGYARLANGKYALAIGDAHVLNDPITGQGANTASRMAWLIGEAICNSAIFDEIFCREIEQRVWEYAGPVAQWSNTMLQPPQPHMIELMVAAAHLQPVADAFVGFFEQPHQAWKLLSSQEEASAFLHQHGWAGMQALQHAA